ncbi:alpha-D-ribose 1-methylphosphonate 5-triphosphate diphosphatase [Halopenitus persicus]|uniref:Alpha-D-ribose 1-methylphosphonate 5-triphosphate diphosphatase n=1 Tax=Halopenitus persicus TaxID=1048396 RepID=A0A1H3LHB8_9EURY|nr:alpha-D-ribose 1-methylphosphonate 5-triphosphate diphosphatase [Halopenitus persicus]SDY63927.1 alpha-D-ribose 1-methylphosphonate 5-triphosphate diphosphatase [Halopenitus persicus]
MSRQQSVATLAITNGQIVTPNGVIEGDVTAVDNRIAAITTNQTGQTDADTVVDADGRYILPGLIDLHGDDIEDHVFPRSGARTADSLALDAADRANVAAGVTTKCHAVSFQDAPEDDRSTDLARDIVDMVAANDDLLADHRIHARCELTDPGCVEAVCEIIDRDIVVMASLMAHVPGQGQFASVESFKQWYMDDAGFDEGEVDEIIETRQKITDDVFDDRIERVTAAATAAGLTVASHDDENPEEVSHRAEKGVSLSEYPVTLDAANRAAEEGMTTAMGAPNLVRGGSQWGNLSTADAIDAGVVDILCADYHPPSLLAAPFVDTGEPLHERVARVTANPAAAIGLDDRGRLEPGARADLLVVDPDPMPTVERAVVAGEDVFCAEASP